jgi:hypothetical protein
VRLERCINRKNPDWIAQTRMTLRCVSRYAPIVRSSYRYLVISSYLSVSQLASRFTVLCSDELISNYHRRSVVVTT